MIHLVLLLFLLLLQCSSNVTANDATFCDQLPNLQIKGFYLYEHVYHGPRVRMLSSDGLYEISDLRQTYHSMIPYPRNWTLDMDVARSVPGNKKIRWFGMVTPIGKPVVQTHGDVSKPKSTVTFYVGKLMVLKPKAQGNIFINHRIIDGLVFFHDPATATPLVISWDLLTCYGKCLENATLIMHFLSMPKHLFWMVRRDNLAIDFVPKDERQPSHELLFPKGLPVGYRIPGQDEMVLFDLTQRLVYHLRWSNGRNTTTDFLTDGNPQKRMYLIKEMPFWRYFGCPEPTPPPTLPPGAPTETEEATEEYQTAGHFTLPTSGKLSGPTILGIPQGQFIAYCAVWGVPLIILGVVLFVFFYCFSQEQIARHMTRVSQAFGGRGKAAAATGKGDAAKGGKWWPKDKGTPASTVTSSTSSTAPATTSSAYAKPTTKKKDGGTRGRNAPTPAATGKHSPTPKRTKDGNRGRAAAADKHSPTPKRTKARTPRQNQQRTPPADKKRDKRAPAK